MFFSRSKVTIHRTELDRLYNIEKEYKALIRQRGGLSNTNNIKEFDMNKFTYLHKKQQELLGELSRVSDMLELKTQKVTLSVNLEGDLLLSGLDGSLIPKDDVGKILNWLQELYGDRQDKPQKESATPPPLEKLTIGVGLQNKVGE